MGPPLVECGGAPRARGLSRVRRWELTDLRPRDAALHLGTTVGLELPESVQRCARPRTQATPAESLQGSWPPCLDAAALVVANLLQIVWESQFN